MKILVYATGQDTGGQGYRIGQGFARHAPDWQIDVLNNAPSVLAYPEHNPGPPGHRRFRARALYEAADVVHLRNNLDGWRQLDRGQHKPIVLHHHGSLFRTSHGAIARGARTIGAVQIASTIDLSLLEPDVEWLPAPYDLSGLAACRAPGSGERIRIAHYPTSAKVKSTAAFLAATERLAERYPIEVLTNVERGRVRHMPWADVLAQKGTADIYFDQVQLGYGNNAIEAWGMGVPVVAGVADPTVRAAMTERFGTLPFYEASEATIEWALQRLIESPAMRDEYAQMGLAHVQRYHDDAKVVARLQRIYGSAQPTRAVPLPRVSRIPGKRIAA